jgi:hypothetical protein
MCRNFGCFFYLLSRIMTQFDRRDFGLEYQFYARRDKLLGFVFCLFSAQI